MKPNKEHNAISTMRELIAIFLRVTFLSILYGIELTSIIERLGYQVKQKLQILEEKLELEKLKGSHSIIELFETYVAHSQYKL